MTKQYDAQQLVDDAVRLRSLFKDADKWTQRVAARDADHMRVQPTSSQAACWCMVGGLMRTGAASNHSALGAINSPIAAMLRDIICEKYPPYKHRPDGMIITDWNDDPRRSFSEVVEVLDEAVVHARAAIEAP